MTKGLIGVISGAGFVIAIVWTYALPDKACDIPQGTATVAWLLTMYTACVVGFIYSIKDKGNAS